MKSRLISMFLVLSLLFTYIPNFSFADELDKDTYEGYVRINNEKDLKKEIKVGESIDLYAIIVDKNGKEITEYDEIDGDIPKYKDFKWSSKDEKIAKVEADNDYKNIGCIKALSSGKVKIQVECTDCEKSKYLEFEINVTDDKPKYEGHVKINNENSLKKEIKVGEDIDLYAIVADKEGKEITSGSGNVLYKDFTWECENKNILELKVDESDSFAASIKGLSPGKSTLKIENKDCKNCEPLKIEIAVVEDKKEENLNIDKIQITLDKKMKEIYIGRNMKVNVQAVDENNKAVKNINIKWEINPKDCAVINENNIVHILKEGQIKIKAIYEKDDKTSIESNVLEIKGTSDGDKQEKINNAIDALMNRYKNPTFYGPETSSSKYTGDLALALRICDMDMEEIDKTKKIFPTGSGSYDLANNARNIMTHISTNEDPIKDVEKILDKSFVFYKDIDENTESQKLIDVIISLDMANANYNKEEAIKALLNIAKEDSEGKVYFESYEHSDVSLTAKALVPLSNHRDIDGVNKTIVKIKKYLKSIQGENGLIKEDAFGTLQDSCMASCETIQGLIAIGENPQGKEWTVEDRYGNKNNLVDAMLLCRENERFKNSLTESVSDIATDAAMVALADLKTNKSMYKEIKYIKGGEPSKIEVENENMKVIEGDEAKIKAFVYDKDNNLIKNLELVWKSEDEAKLSVKDGNIKGLKEGDIKITVSLKDKPEITKSILVKVQSGVSNEILKEKLEKEINDLKTYYKGYNQYEFLAAPAASILGMDKDTIKKHIVISVNGNTAMLCAKNIIALIGAEGNPRDYKSNNYVDKLRASQVKEGENKGQFLINNVSDKNNIEALSYSIIALDISDAKYDKKEAVNALIKLLKDTDKKNNQKYNSYKEVRSEAIALTALSNHKDIEKVNENIQNIINFLKEKQCDNGAFEIDGRKGNPIVTGAVIQGLIANGINPLYSKEWIKNKQTMLDGMSVCRGINIKGEPVLGFAEYEGGNVSYQGTYYAFGAFADMYANESMFKKLAIKYNESLGIPSEISIKKLDSNKMIVGQKLKLNANAFDNKNNWLENEKIKWNVSDESLASIDENGELTAKKAGNVIVTASSEGIKSTVDISIEDAGIKSIKILFNKNKIRVGDKVHFSAIGFDKANNKIEDITAIGTSSNKDIIDTWTADGDIYIKANAKGSAIISVALANNKDIKDEIKIEVIDKKSINVKVRVEGNKGTIVPQANLEVDNFELGYYGDNRCLLSENPNAMNALILALYKNKIDCEEKEKFNAGYDLSNVNNINGLKNGSVGEKDGWMYFVNNKYMDHTLIEHNIKDGDSICVFFVNDYTKDCYSYFDKEEVKAKSNTNVDLNLKCIIKNVNTGSQKEINLDNAKILVNGKEYIVNGQPVLTSNEGNVSLKFEKEGEYIISAAKENIIKPYCKIVVTNDVVKESKFEIKGFEENNLEKGEEAKLKADIKNISKEDSNLICIVGLYDDMGKRLKHSCLEKTLKVGKEVNLSPGFSIPNNGKYKIKIFISDTKENIDITKPFKEININ